jgi:ribonuclease HI
MNSTIIYIYTDASYNKAHQLAVLGYAIFFAAENHQEQAITEQNIKCMQLQEQNNIRAELRGALWALQSLKDISSKQKIIIFTDCQTLQRLSMRRAKLESTCFKSLSKNNELANADLYREFFKFYDQYHIEIQWVKGHAPKNNLTFIEQNFAQLDKSVRKNLRQIIAGLS